MLNVCEWTVIEKKTNSECTVVEKKRRKRLE